MAFNFMESRMEKTIAKIKKTASIDASSLEVILNEIKSVLLESDVNYSVVNNFISQVKSVAEGKLIEENKNKAEEIIEILYQELTKILGSQTSEWKKTPKTVIMMVGLQGSGKTTSTSKIAKFLHKEKGYKNPLLISLDVYRPAAMEQLNKLADDLGYLFYSDRYSKDVVQITNDAMEFASDMEADLIILDTAGRIQTDEALMHELIEVKKIAKPTEIIFVADGMGGQEIINVAKEFDNTLKLTSSIISKMDSNAKGGASLSIVSLLNVPIKFIGIGEKVDDIEVFHPDRMASRILGLGDLETLKEKASKVSKESDNERLMRKMMSGKFDLEDLLISLEQLAKMGSLKSITKMLPGMKISQEQSEKAEEQVYVFKILINSMTSKEKKNPKLIKHPRRSARIIKGSGRTSKELNDLLRQFEKSQKQMKVLAKYAKNGDLPTDMLLKAPQ